MLGFLFLADRLRVAFVPVRRTRGRRHAFLCWLRWLVLPGAGWLRRRGRSHGLGLLRVDHDYPPFRSLAWRRLRLRPIVPARFTAPHSGLTQYRRDSRLITSVLLYERASLVF